jgi:hypothetical protein
MASTARMFMQLPTASATTNQAEAAATRTRFEYKLLSADGLPVGELNALLARHRREGWVLVQLLLEDEDRIAEFNDLNELGILLKRERRT